MIVDSSAIVSILLHEPAAETLVDKLLAADQKGIGVPTLVETGIVLTARVGDEAVALLSQFLQFFGVVPVPFTARHWTVAIEAFRRYGKGRHPAALNFGDCLSYATARLAGRPLLFVGSDFSRTDLEAA